MRLATVAAISIAGLSAAPALTRTAPASAAPGTGHQGARALAARPTPTGAPRPVSPGHASARSSAAPTPAPATATAPVSSSRIRGHEPAAILRHRSHGTAAVKALGSNLPSVAARTGWSSHKLRAVLSTDDTAYVSPQGAVYYQEQDPAASTTAATSATPNVAPRYPTSQTFALHSRPAATRKIFLDFDGATVSNTGWNGTGSGKVANGTHTGFSLDGSPGTFTTAEHGYIQEVWREVSEDYSPFDVDVTTQDPGVAGIVRSSASDTHFGTHVVITSEPAVQKGLCPPDPKTKAATTCLGLAWVGTFDNVDTSGYYQPAWVFDYSKSFDPMIIAQAAAHETGHTLGLSHDGIKTGTTTNPYYGGTAAWGPIMGSSMYRAVSQFSKGEYAGANNTQDDLAIIASNGLPLRADDYASTDNLGVRPAYSVSGVISTRSDADTFSISLPCTTTLDVAANGIGAQSALDLKLTVSNGSGQVLQTISPASGYSYTGGVPVSTGMNAATSIPDATGTYVLRVEGVGNGSPANGGWSDYDSLGQYTLTASGCPGVTATPSGTTGQTTAKTTSSATVTPAPRHAPSAPRTGWVTSGTPGGAVTATVRWYAPTSTGGAAITHYRLQAEHLDSHHRVLRSQTSGYIAPNVRGVTVHLAKGPYRFRLVALNAVGTSAWSSLSRIVDAR